MDRIPQQSTAVLVGAASVALAGVTIYFWKLTNDKVRKLAVARKNVMGTLDRVRAKGGTVGEELWDVQKSLSEWSVKCERFSYEAASTIDQIKRDLHQYMLESDGEFMSEEEVDYEQDGDFDTAEGSSQHGENENEDEFGEENTHRLHHADSARVLTEVKNQNHIGAMQAGGKMANGVQTNGILNGAAATKQLHTQAQQQLLNIQKHVNQASALLTASNDVVLGN